MCSKQLYCKLWAPWTVWQELKVDVTNITPSKSARNNIRTVQKGIISIKTLIKKGKLAARHQLNPEPYGMKIFISIHYKAYIKCIERLGTIYTIWRMWKNPWGSVTFSKVSD